MNLMTSQSVASPRRRSRGPERFCVGCGRRTEPAQLLRFAVGPNSEIVADLVQRSFGRGVWVHPRIDCLTKAAKSGFAKSLKRQVDVTLSSLLAALEPAVERRCLGLISAAAGARAVLWGTDSVRAGVKSVKVVVLAEDARSAAQEDWLVDFVNQGRLVRWGTKSMFGNIFCRDEVAVLGLCDAGIAKAVLAAIGLSRLATSGRDAGVELSEVQ